MTEKLRFVNISVQLRMDSVQDVVMYAVMVC